VSFLSNRSRLFAILMLMLVYLVVLWLGLTEESRRSVVVTKTAASNSNFVIVEIKISSVDTASGLLHERIKLIPSGRFALDQVTPAVDLELLSNSVSGKQTVRYPRGERIFPIDFTSGLSGNQNRYPFDKYMADIDVLVTVPQRTKEKAVQPESPEDSATPLASGLVVGASLLNNSETVPIREDFSASLPGVKFRSAITPDDTTHLMHTSIAMRRADNVISVSILVMIGMFGIAISIMGMVFKTVASPNEINLAPLSLCVALIFGLPALRNVQPGVPGVGVLSDYISFIWAEFIVSTSGITLAWLWIIRSKHTGAK
jgi:hypothetical protein